MNAQEMYDTGLPILTALFNMPHKELRQKLLSICPEHEEIITKGVVERISIDDIPTRINVHYYDSIEVTVLGIGFQSEYGKYSHIASFNQHFKL